jgi:hypothetical protein
LVNSAASLNPFGVIAICGLIGMFSRNAILKLNEVFLALFRPPDIDHEVTDGRPHSTNDAPDINRKQ